MYAHDTVGHHSVVPVLSLHANPLTVDRNALWAFCQRHHIKRLALFGSVLRDDFGPGSDVYWKERI